MVQIRGEPLFSSNSPFCEADNGEITSKVIIETAARTRPDGTPVPAKPLPKSLLWSVWQQIESVHSAALGGLRPAYDGRSAVYTNRQLPSSPLVVRFFFAFSVHLDIFVTDSLSFRSPQQIQGITIPDGKKGTFTATVSRKTEWSHSFAS